MKSLPDCHWVPRWVSHLGCIKGCLDYLGIDVSDAMLYGATGHGFIINMHEEVCPSGPTAWNTRRMTTLGQNLGYKTDAVLAFRSARDFATQQEAAWQLARTAIDAGHPCYAWEIEIPEFYIINGYNETGYFYSGPMKDEGAGPKRWRELGMTEIGILELYSVTPGTSEKPEKILREALAFALEFAEHPGDMVQEHYHSGIAGFDAWIRAVESGTASDMGMQYNTAVWTECRSFAAQFLHEIRGGLELTWSETAHLLDHAIDRYETVADSLGDLEQLYPWRPETHEDGATIKDDIRRDQAVDLLRRARDAEAQGLETLHEILEETG
jgi:hypothetical protein